MKYHHKYPHSLCLLVHKLYILMEIHNALILIMHVYTYMLIQYRQHHIKNLPRTLRSLEVKLHVCIRIFIENTCFDYNGFHIRMYKCMRAYACAFMHTCVCACMHVCMNI